MGMTIIEQVINRLNSVGIPAIRGYPARKAPALPDVQAAVKAVADALGDTGRILVRESGTEPVIRVMVEAETDEICEKYVDQVIDVIREKGHMA